MEALEQQFNSRVRVFLGRTGVSPTTFGMKALGDAHLVRQLDGGRSPSLRTADRILAFVADYDLDSGGPRTPPRGHRRRKPSSRARRTRRSRAMTGARLTAALECANDAGGRCALWPSGDAHACYGVSHDTATSCAFAVGSVSAARAALTGAGATPQSKGLVRVRRQVCLRTPAPVPSGSLPANYPYAGRRFSAASRRRSTSSPAPCPSGYRTSPLRRPWCNRKAAIDIQNRWRAHRNGGSVHMHLDVDVHARYTTDPR